MIRIRTLGAFVLALAIPQAVGALGSLATIPSIPTWYATLQRPALAPPNVVFGPVWTTLFLLMGIASYLVWRTGKGVRRTEALRVYGIQLALNLGWSLLFFGLHRPDLAAVEIVFLWLAILWNTILFFRISRVAGLLLVPYLGWVAFASYLNIAIWRLNL